MLATIGRAVEWLKRPLDEGGCIFIRDSLRPGGTSYGLKHHFSADSDECPPNGAFIIALAMAGCTLKRVNLDRLNAKSEFALCGSLARLTGHRTEPRRRSGRDGIQWVRS